MLKIRLLRIGAKKKPFYRVVAVDERTKRNGAYIELLGTYNPLTEPKDIQLKQDRIDYWVKLGAQLSTGYLRIIGKAPQRPPRKPKKAKEDAQQPKTEKQVKEEKPEETVKSSESESTGAVESAPETGTSEKSDSQQTGSEAQSETSQQQTSEPSGDSTTDEPAPAEETK